MDRTHSSSQREMEMKRPHVVCIPFPTQGHINPMMHIAKLLHSRGFLISFVNTDYSYQRLVRSGSLDSVECLDGFRFMTISDGLPPSSGEGSKDALAFLEAIKKCVEPFRELLRELHHPPNGHRVTCIVSDSVMTFTMKVAEEMGIPEMIFCPMAACAFMAVAQYPELVRRGLIPLKDESHKSNGYLDTTIDWIPGMKAIRLRDLGSFVQSTDPSNDFLRNFVADEAQNTLKASVIIFNTFDDLEHEVLHAIRAVFPPRIYSIGPLSMQCRLIPDSRMKSVKSSLWKEETECLKWLDSCEASSVIYVNFGSVAVITEQQLIEFGWGIANSNNAFMWVIRPDLLMGGHAKLPQDFLDEIEGRGMVVSWCPQEEVLAHPSISFFLTHCGWNSTLESLSFGVPMLCWPFFSDQQTNCCYACNEWGVGLEIGNNPERDEISSLIKEIMEGEKGKEMREKALKWMESAERSINEGGSSHTNLKLLIHEIAELAKTEM